MLWLRISGLYDYVKSYKEGCVWYMTSIESMSGLLFIDNYTINYRAKIGLDDSAIK